MQQVWWRIQKCTKIILLISTCANNILSTSLLSKYQHRIVFVKDNHISTLLKYNPIEYGVTKNISGQY